MFGQEEIPQVGLLEAFVKASFTPQHAFTAVRSAPALGWALGTLMSQACLPNPLASGSHTGCVLCLAQSCGLVCRTSVWALAGCGCC